MMPPVAVPAIATAAPPLAESAVQSPMKGGYVQIPGGRLFYVEGGRGEAVVLIPPFAADTRYYSPQISGLIEAGYHVVVYDPRGFGQSSSPIEGKHYDNTEDLAALLDFLRISRAHIVGVSNGGRIALDFALTHPRRVASVTAVDSAVSGYSPPEVASYFAGLHESAVQKGSGAAKEELSRFGAFAPAIANPKSGPLMRAMISDYSGWHLLHADPEVVPTPPTIERLGEIAAPALVILGDRDIPDFHVLHQRVASSIPGAKPLVIPGAGHFATIEAPSVFNAALNEFLRAHPIPERAR